MGAHSESFIFRCILSVPLIHFSAQIQNEHIVGVKGFASERNFGQFNMIDIHAMEYSETFLELFRLDFVESRFVTTFQFSVRTSVR